MDEIKCVTAEIKGMDLKLICRLAGSLDLGFKGLIWKSRGRSNKFSQSVRVIINLKLMHKKAKKGVGQSKNFGKSTMQATPAEPGPKVQDQPERPQLT